MKTITKQLKKNININYLYSFILNFDVTGAIWVLYLSFKGMNLIQIGLLEGVYHIVGFLCEVPSGAMADLLGRKKTVLLGRFLCLASRVLMIFAGSFWGFAFAFTIQALSYNMNSGSAEALIFDSLKQLKKEKEYLGINGRINFLVEIAGAIAVFSGGVLAKYSYSYCYIAAMILGLCEIILVLNFKEPEIHTKQEEETISIKKHFQTCYHIMKENKQVRNILLYYPMTFTFFMVIFFYGQEYFQGMHLNTVRISICLLIQGLLSASGAACAKSLMNITNGKIKYLASVFMGITILLYGIMDLRIAIPAFCIMGFMYGLLTPISSDSLNSKIPSEQRATIISVSSMMYSMMMIIIFPISGVIAEWIGLSKTFFGIGILQLIIMIFLLFTLNKRKSL